MFIRFRAGMDKKQFFLAQNRLRRMKQTKREGVKFQKKTKILEVKQIQIVYFTDAR